ncbi:MAG: hypothetical protein GY756_27050 [bacterium]|nr:hypothetical protein [bacterium]
MKNKIPKCYNCIHAGDSFKLGKITHLHCENKKKYPEEEYKNGNLTAWDSLMEFSGTCKDHEFKLKK